MLFSNSSIVKIKNNYYTRMFVFLLILLYMLVILICFSSFMIYFQSYAKDMSVTNLTMISYVNEKIDNLLSEVISISDPLYIDTEINDILSSESEKYKINQLRFRNYFSNYRSFNPNLNYQIDLFDFENNHYTFYTSAAQTHNFLSINSVKEYFWYNQVMKANGQTCWYDGATVSENAKDWVFAIRVVKSARVNKTKGIVVISFLKNRIDKVLNNTRAIDIKIGISDQNGNIIFGNNANDIILDPVKLMASDTGYYTSENGSTLIVYSKNKKSGWYVVQSMRLPTFFNFLEKLISPLIAVLLFSLILAGAITYAFYRKISDPIFSLVKCMKLVETGELDPPALNLIRDDEIGMLNRCFSQMVAELKNLLEKLMEEQEKKRTADLEVLQSQINPHFLYNTLGSARYLIKIGQTNEANSVIIALIKLLKMNLNPKVHLIKIADEVECLKNYITIQKYKYENFNVDFNIDTSLSNMLIPKLLIQPLVENCIFHGFNSGEVYGHIEISIQAAQNNKIRVCVKDNGKGIAESRFDNLFKVVSEKNGSGIGLNNVNSRLILQYGMESSLHIFNCPEGGVEASFLIPREGRTESEKNSNC